MAIELRHLRHALALAEHGHFGRAADALHLTQSALTRSIQALEALVGATVFERHRRGIEPTAIGRLLLRHAGTLVAATHDLDHELRLTRGLELGELRVAAGPFGASALIGPVIGRLNRQHPRLHVRVVVAPWQELPARAQSREVDLIVAELSEIEQLDEFQWIALSPQQPIVVCRSGHPLTAQPAPQANDVFGYPLVGPRLPRHAVQALARAAQADRRSGPGRAPPQAVECDSATVLKSILLASDAVSMMPRFMVEAELRSGQLRALPEIDLRLTVRFGIAWLKQRSLSAAGEKFVELLRGHDEALATLRDPGPAGRRAPKRRRSG